MSMRIGDYSTAREVLESNVAKLKADFGSKGVAGKIKDKLIAIFGSKGEKVELQNRKMKKMKSIVLYKTK